MTDTSSRLRPTRARSTPSLREVFTRAARHGRLERRSMKPRPRAGRPVVGGVS